MLLQRDVEVVLESSNNNNFVGSVLHPMGNIAEALLKEGMAKCVDWSISKVGTVPAFDTLIFTGLRNVL